MAKTLQFYGQSLILTLFILVIIAIATILPTHTTTATFSPTQQPNQPITLKITEVLPVYTQDDYVGNRIEIGTIPTIVYDYQGPAATIKIMLVRRGWETPYHLVSRTITTEEGLTLQSHESLVQISADTIIPSNTAYFYLHIDSPTPGEAPIKSKPSEIYELFEIKWSSSGDIHHVWKMHAGTNIFCAQPPPITNVVI